MIRLNTKNKKGITMVTLIITITIMIIITTTLVYNITTGAKVKALDNMYNDIAKLKDKIDIYYSKHNTIPIVNAKYENVNSIESLNPNDNDNYYVIDLSALDNLNLSYGQDYYTYQANPSNQLTNLYIINERSHSIYYPKGVTFDNKVYYTEPTQSTKVELSENLKIDVIEENDKSINIKLSAVDKTNGINKIILMVDDEEYKTYEYNSNLYDLKTEIIQIDLNEDERECYFIAEDESGENINESDTIIIKKAVTQATAKKAAKKVTATTIDETMEEITDEMPDEITDEMPDEITDEITDEIMDETIQEITDEATDEMTQEIKQETIQETLQETAQGTIETIAQETTQETTQKEVAQELAEELTKDVSQELTKELAQELAQELVGGLTQELSEDTTQEVNSNTILQAIWKIIKEIYEKNLFDKNT